MLKVKKEVHELSKGSYSSDTPEVIHRIIVLHPVPTIYYYGDSNQDDLEAHRKKCIENNINFRITTFVEKKPDEVFEVNKNSIQKIWTTIEKLWQFFHSHEKSFDVLKKEYDDLERSYGKRLLNNHKFCLENKTHNNALIVRLTLLETKVSEIKQQIKHVPKPDIIHPAIREQAINDLTLTPLPKN